jgi:hydroxyacyl-ACP dehydratase HTD2-like protein with hotdog domain
MSVLPHCGEVVSEENKVKDLGEEGYRSLAKMLQDPVRYTVRAWSLADFETPDDVLNLVRVR